MKNNFKKLLASATLAYVATFGSSLSVVASNNSSSLGLRTPDFYVEKYSGKGSLASLSGDCKDREDCMGGCFSTTVGYQMNFKSRGSDDLAKGIFNNNGSAEKNNAEIVVGDSKSNFDASHLINMWFPASATPAPATDINPWVTNTNESAGSTNGSEGIAKISTAPKTQAGYVNLNYTHDLSNYFYDGLSFYVSASAVWMKNTLNPTFTVTTPISTSTNVAATGQTYTNETQLKTYGIGGGAGNTYTVTNGFGSLYNGLTVEDAFTGKDGKAGSPNFQKGLRYARLVNAPSEVNIPDIRMGLSLRVINSENVNASVGVDGAIPTNSSEADAVKYLYSAKVSQNHFKLGLSGCADACLAEGADYKASLLINALWHYGFERERFRLLGHSESNLNLYQLAVRKSDIKADVEAATTLSAEPVINLIMDDAGKMKVQPGYSFLLHPMINVEKGCFVVGAGYSLHYASEEKVAIPASIKEKGGYVLLSSAKAMNGAQQLVSADITDGNTFDTNKLVGGQQSSTLHYFHVNLGVACKEWQYPAGAALTVGYEMSSDRQKNREVFNVGLTGSICF